MDSLEKGRKVLREHILANKEQVSKDLREMREKSSPVKKKYTIIEKEILEIDGKIQLMNRKWYQLFKNGWYKHLDFFNRKWWIRFKW